MYLHGHSLTLYTCILDISEDLYLEYLRRPVTNVVKGLTFAVLQVDAQRLTKLISKQLFGRVVAVNELVLVHLDGLALIIRIANVNTLDEAAKEEALSYHCYRGLVTPDTIIYLTEGESAFVCPTPCHMLHCHAAEPAEMVSALGLLGLHFQRVDGVHGVLLPVQGM